MGDLTALPAGLLPRSLAEIHRDLNVGDLVELRFVDGVGNLDDLLEGAGFEATTRPVIEAGTVTVGAERLHTLADTVGPEMSILFCGLNPSPHAAESGIGFSRPGNRFWPAAMSAGLLTVDRDPMHALEQHGVGMTDLAKRTTRRAAELSTDEYRHGMTRVERLVRWLQPRVVCFVGLAGWRTVVDRRATAGVQPTRLGDRPVYLMPSTSGLNANSRMDDFIAHFTTIRRLGFRTCAG